MINSIDRNKRHIECSDHLIIQTQEERHTHTQLLKTHWIRLYYTVYSNIQVAAGINGLMDYILIIKYIINFHSGGDKQVSQLGLARFDLQILQLHSHAHVPSDLQFPFEEGLRAKMTDENTF